jgi:hypothetical protein
MEKETKNYELFIAELKQDFYFKYPDLRLEGIPYGKYVFNFIESAVQDAIKNVKK